jgi:hypothetical protein
VDEQQKTSLTTGFGVYSIAEVWEWQSQLNRKVKNKKIVYAVVSIETIVPAVVDGGFNWKQSI